MVLNEDLERLSGLVAQAEKRIRTDGDKKYYVDFPSLQILIEGGARVLRNTKQGSGTSYLVEVEYRGHIFTHSSFVPIDLPR